MSSGVRRTLRGHAGKEHARAASRKRDTERKLTHVHHPRARPRVERALLLPVQLGLGSLNGEDGADIERMFAERLNERRRSGKLERLDTEGDTPARRSAQSGVGVRGSGRWQGRREFARGTGRKGAREWDSRCDSKGWHWEGIARWAIAGAAHTSEAGWPTRRRRLDVVTPEDSDDANERRWEGVVLTIDGQAVSRGGACAAWRTVSGEDA